MCLFLSSFMRLQSNCSQGYCILEFLQFNELFATQPFSLPGRKTLLKSDIEFEVLVREFQ